MAAKLSRREREVMLRTLYQQPMRATPGVPDEKTARLALELVVEESFEMLEAAFNAPLTKTIIEDAKRRMVSLVRNAALSVDMPALADALEDINVVVEQCNLAFGVDNGPVAEEVFRANYTKANGPVDEVTGKRLKPPGFKPPDVARVLIEQGWVNEGGYDGREQG